MVPGVIFRRGGKNKCWAFWNIQDGGQDGRQAKMGLNSIQENVSISLNNALRVKNLVSKHMFSTMPDPMKPSKTMHNMQLTWKSKMAAKMAADHSRNRRDYRKKQL